MRLVHRIRSTSTPGVAVVAALPREAWAVDPVGLGSVLLFGFPLGTRTVFREVEACATCRPSAEGFDAYGLRPWSRRPDAGEIDELLDAALADASAASPEPPVLMLSGGRDSRLIMIALLRRSARPRVAISTGSGEDRAVARRLAAHHGIPFREVAPAPFSREGERRRHGLLSYASLEHSWMLRAADVARGYGGPITDGVGAGVLPTGFFLKPAVRAMWTEGRLDAIADWCVEEGAGVGERMYRALRADGVPLADVDDARQEFVRMLRDLERYPNPLGTLSLLHWTGRGIAASAFGLLGHDRPVIAPFFDRRLCEALLAIEMEEAVRSDWRDELLRIHDRSGILHSVDSGASARGLLDRIRAKYEWRRFQAAAHPSLRRHAAERADGPAHRRFFQRTALTLLDALDRAHGILPASPRVGPLGRDRAGDRPHS